ncbi:MAG: condensation domain-containing protein, partial [Pyrinomonadaceae bacterium]
MLTREEGDSDKRLVAYVVANAQASDAESQPHDAEWSIQRGDDSPEIKLNQKLAGELRGFLKNQLPNYMLPSSVVLVEEFPLTTHGKVDRSALPAPDHTRPELEEPFVPPRTDAEQKLAGIWTEVLGIEGISVNDNFFDLGGHSLLATQAISRARDAFQTEMQLQSIFDHPTVATLAQYISQQTGGGNGAQQIPGSPKAGHYPLSYGQQRLWFIEQLMPGNTAYHIHETIHFTDPLNRAALEQSLREIVRRHESLRTVFASRDGEPVQLISPSLVLPLHFLDLSHLQDAEQNAQLQLFYAAELDRRFSLSSGPLLRTSLVRLAHNHHLLVVCMHHIISDGWSMKVFRRELDLLYEAFSQGQPSPLSDLPIQYADYAVWQRDHLTGRVLEEHLSYWRTQLRGAPEVLELPADRQRPLAQSYRGAYRWWVLSEELSEGVKALSREAGVTLFMSLLAGFEVLLWRYTGEEDVVVGTPIANRQRTEVEGVIGFFVNTVVLRVRVRGEMRVRELLREIKEVTLSAYGHQEMPFERLVAEMRPERDLRHNPLFQVLFALQNQNAPSGAAQVSAQAGLMAEEMGTKAEAITHVETMSATFDLT